jgi:hypothetical protein
MCLEVRCIDRDGPVTRCLFGARPIMILANTPMSLQRFQRSYRVFGGQYAAGASHRRRRGLVRSHLKTSFDVLSGHVARTGAHTIAIEDDNFAQNASVINAGTALALRKVRSKPRHPRFAQPIKIAHDILS